MRTTGNKWAYGLSGFFVGMYVLVGMYSDVFDLGRVADLKTGVWTWNIRLVLNSCYVDGVVQMWGCTELVMNSWNFLFVWGYMWAWMDSDFWIGRRSVAVAKTDGWTGNIRLLLCSCCIYGD
jgi:hypothetical protein